jgi:dihydrofolate reductase
MRKLILCSHTSLDGYVAGPNKEMDWINVDEHLFEYTGMLTDNADTALYGRVTYQMMEEYWPTADEQVSASKHDIQHSLWYKNSTKIVISKTMKDRNITNTIILSENIIDQVQRIKQQDGKNILIFGSPTASHMLMHHNLIDDFWLFVNPILIGEGIPIFKNINEKVNLKLVESNVMSSGVVVSHYER